MGAQNNSMLAPYRVLDLTDKWGFLCGRILADFGCDVIKIEKPGGDLERNIGPFYHDIPHPEKSLYWFFYNANKRSITLNIETVDGKEIFKKLTRKADFIIESFKPGYMDSLGLGYQALSEINARVILTSITPWGQSGPYSKYKGSDIVNTALSGWMFKCGDPDKAPVRIASPQIYPHGGALAAGSTLIAHYYREMTGEGQHVDVSAQRWLTYSSQVAMRWDVTKVNESRHGQKWEWAGRPLVRYVWDCKDGSICFSIMGGARFGRTQKALVEWMDSEGMATDYLKNIKWETLDYGSVSQDFRDGFEEPVAKFLKQKTKAELFKEAVKRGIVIYPASTAKELLEDPQLASRGYWAEVPHPELGTNITYPGAFFKSSETSWKITRRPPLIGEHNEEVYVNELGFSKDELITLKGNNII